MSEICSALLYFQTRHKHHVIDSFNDIIFHIRMGNGYFVDKNLTLSLIAQTSMFQHFRMSFDPSICLSHLYAIKGAYIHSESTIITLIWFEIFDRFSLSLSFAHSPSLLSTLFNWFFVLLLDFVMLFRHVQFCVIKENRSIDVPEKSLVVWETKKKLSETHVGTNYRIRNLISCWIFPSMIHIYAYALLLSYSLSVHFKWNKRFQ